jgi:fibronectin type 3 domain-containing protein
MPRSLRIHLLYAVPDTTAGRLDYLTVRWTDSVDPNAVSNNIYRSTVSGGFYVKIANVPNGVQVYNDYAVTPGVTYYYVLTEVDNTGAESGFSVQQSAKAPGGPS